MRINYPFQGLLVGKKSVCTDLITLSLEGSGLINTSKTKNPFFWRRVTNVENYANKHSEDFTIQKIKEIKPADLKGCLPGDIITITHDSGAKHIGIVSKVNEQGNPTSILHTKYDGVRETPFVSTRCVGQDYQKDNRYDGFITPSKNDKLAFIIRPTKQSISVAMNKEKLSSESV